MCMNYEIDAFPKSLKPTCWTSASDSPFWVEKAPEKTLTLGEFSRVVWMWVPTLRPTNMELWK